MNRLKNFFVDLQKREIIANYANSEDFLSPKRGRKRNLLGNGLYNRKPPHWSFIPMLPNRSLY